MKLLLELLGDSCQLLSGLNNLDDLRPEARERVEVLLQNIRVESTRLLENSGEKHIIEASEHEGGQRDIVLQRTLEALAGERFSDAATILEEGIRLFPDDDEFYSYMGLIAWEQKDLKKAERYYHKAMVLALAPQGPGGRGAMNDARQLRGLRAMEGQALCLYRMKRYEEALPLFEQLGSCTFEEFRGCRYMAGEIRHYLNDIDGAIAHYRSVAPEPAVLYNLGLAFFQKDALENAAATLVRGFVSNVYVVCMMLGRYSYHKSCVPGYLGSELYAEEFVDACITLWQNVPGSFGFMERCFDHNLVQSHLERCAEQGGEKLLATPEGLSEQNGWMEQFHDPAVLAGIAQRVLQRLDA